MQQLVLLLHVIISIFLIVLVLVQHGKGADIGAAFGSGASQTVFGSQGSGSFLMKLTGVFAAAFFATSLALGYMAAHANKPKSDELITPVHQDTLPVIPANLSATPANTSKNVINNSSQKKN